MGTKIPEEYRDLLTKKKAFASVATVMPDGTPQVTPVWIDYDGERLVFNTAVGRIKERNIRRNPEVAVAILDPDDPYRYIQIRGKAELQTDGAEEHIDALAHKYLGVDEYPNRQPDEQRVKVLVTPEEVNAQG